MRGPIALVLAMVLGLFLTSHMASADPKPAEVAKLRYPPEFILNEVLGYLRLKLPSAAPVPTIYFESQTPLTQFQQAVKAQWGFAPERFSNAYIISQGDIYLVDEADYYQRLRRTIDDSLAHELTHYIQDRYQNYDLINDHSAEDIAIDVQTWFRETHMPEARRGFGLNSSIVNTCFYKRTKLKEM